ncbi:hypothetical protein ACFLRF_00695 [Candidatus Altiarchaeota archaeon]
MAQVGSIEGRMGREKTIWRVLFYISIILVSSAHATALPSWITPEGDCYSFEFAGNRQVICGQSGKKVLTSYIIDGQDYSAPDKSEEPWTYDEGYTKKDGHNYAIVNSGLMDLEYSDEEFAVLKKTDGNAGLSQVSRYFIERSDPLIYFIEAKHFEPDGLVFNNQRVFMWGTDMFGTPSWNLRFVDVYGITREAQSKNLIMGVDRIPDSFYWEELHAETSNDNACGNIVLGTTDPQLIRYPSTGTTTTGWYETQLSYFMSGEANNIYLASEKDAATINYMGCVDGYGGIHDRATELYSTHANTEVAEDIVSSHPWYKAVVFMNAHINCRYNNYCYLIDVVGGGYGNGDVFIQKAYEGTNSLMYASVKDSGHTVNPDGMTAWVEQKPTNLDFKREYTVYDDSPLVRVDVTVTMRASANIGEVKMTYYHRSQTFAYHLDDDFFELKLSTPKGEYGVDIIGDDITVRQSGASRYIDVPVLSAGNYQEGYSKTVTYYIYPHEGWFNTVPDLPTPAPRMRDINFRNIGGGFAMKPTYSSKEHNVASDGTHLGFDMWSDGEDIILYVMDKTVSSVLVNGTPAAGWSQDGDELSFTASDGMYNYEIWFGNGTTTTTTILTSTTITTTTMQTSTTLGPTTTTTDTTSTTMQPTTTIQSTSTTQTTTTTNTGIDCTWNPSVAGVVDCGEDNYVRGVDFNTNEVLCCTR